MFTYCIEELQFRAKEHPNSPNGAIRVYNGDVYKSDTAVSEETKLALQKAVRVLEDIPAAQKDWRPGSDGKILDLVHPSLFPLIYGKGLSSRSQIYGDSGLGRKRIVWIEYMYKRGHIYCH
jgi:hypothetical protein